MLVGNPLLQSRLKCLTSICTVFYAPQRKQRIFFYFCVTTTNKSSFLPLQVQAALLTLTAFLLTQLTQLTAFKTAQHGGSHICTRCSCLMRLLINKFFLKKTTTQPTHRYQHFSYLTTYQSQQTAVWTLYLIQFSRPKLLNFWTLCLQRKTELGSIWRSKQPNSHFKLGPKTVILWAKQCVLF